MNDVIKKLVEARQAWNNLDDAVYNLAGGDLSNSNFAVIYNNYESYVLSELVKQFPWHEKFLNEYFCGIILNIATYNFAIVICDDAEEHITTDNFQQVLNICDKLEYVEL